MLLTKTFRNYVVCLGVKNNSRGNSSSSKFFLFSLNILPVLLFSADFNLFKFLLVNLTLTPDN